MAKSLTARIMDEWISNLPILKYDFNKAYNALIAYVLNNGLNPSQLTTINLPYRRENRMPVQVVAVACKEDIDHNVFILGEDASDMFDKVNSRKTLKLIPDRYKQRLASKIAKIMEVNDIKTFDGRDYI